MCSTPRDQAVVLLQRTQRLLVFSGAGLSKASGLPTYRDLGGLWSQTDNLPFSQAEHLARNPRGFIRFWKKRLVEVERASPNPAHYALATLHGIIPETTHVTQNIDGLLQLAGVAPVIELHGTLRARHCQRCGKIPLAWAPGWRCWRCGGLLRPDVVLFGESLSDNLFLSALTAARDCDTLLVVGTSNTVYPAMRVVETALRFGARLIVVDPANTSLGQVAHVNIRENAEDALPFIVPSLGNSLEEPSKQK